MLNFNSYNSYNSGSSRFLDQLQLDQLELDIENQQEYNEDLEIEREILMNPSGRTPARIQDDN